jgi:hypothetical protein
LRLIKDGRQGGRQHVAQVRERRTTLLAGRHGGR